MLKNLEELLKTIRDRKNNPKENSYTNKLLADKKLSVSKVKEEIISLALSVALLMAFMRAACSPAIDSSIASRI